MPGQLFTQYFLTDGIRETAEWQESVARQEESNAFLDDVRRSHDALADSSDPNEATTEQDLIRPVLELLGWKDYLPQQGTSGKEDIPDHLLFSDADSKTRAATRENSSDRYLDALVVQESKRFNLPLDQRGDEDNAQPGSPHGQILRYLTTADSMTDGRIRWGILTNGSIWRLYDHRARPRSSGYYETDLKELLDSSSNEGLRVFQLMFRRESFTLQEGAKTTFLDIALAEGRRYEDRVARDLSEVVFDTVFPQLVEALAQESQQGVDEIRDGALIFLYRLLFVLYAEDRGLLPVNDPRYDDYGLRKRVRDDIADRMAQGDTFSQTAANYFNRLVELFRVIDRGDVSIGLPPYNGGLFAADAAPILNEVRLPDAAVAPVIYAMSHGEMEGENRFVNYRDMSVQQLGSIYERLLERELTRNEDGTVDIRPNAYARKDSGSFYTPQELVDLIVDRTLKPLAEERLKAFETRSEALRRDRRPRQARLAELRKYDPAKAVLNLKVLDPAMGSGHFLVTAVDYLSDYVAELIEYVPAVPDWLDEPYVSPLVRRIERIRGEILKRAEVANWVIDVAQLTDQAIIRRMVLKRCIYGVDKNRLTVELAKVSLWLHSFTAGAPLSFLDHHLRCGDSLVGLRVYDAMWMLNELGGLAATSAVAGAETATVGMRRIEEMSDADISEVHESASLFTQVEATTADLRGLMDFLRGWNWMTAAMKKKELIEFKVPMVTALEAHFQNGFDLLAHGPDDEYDVSPEFTRKWENARDIADREDFLHWEVAFPGVWRYWTNPTPEGGFDAIIGNPPWDRIKLQEVEWFATRASVLARASTAAARKKEIERLRAEGDPLATSFDEAKTRADGLGRLIRATGDYPLLGGGDVNLYSLFVERAMNLIKPDGLVGLLTPSGIYADKTAARFFKTVSTSGRVSGLYDFENRRLGTGLPAFFPDVDSRFKFCALIFGGEKRKFEQTECAFFLHDTDTIHDRDRCFPLTPEDFTRVNPNTGTAPVFRHRRDAEITREIYERHPVLVDRSGSEERRVWSIKYLRMFDMTNDSHLFRTAIQLDAEGFYPVQENKWKRDNDVYVPLYQGRMIWQFDHRASSVRVNPENLHNPYISEEVTEAQHAEPGFLPQTQYWVPARNVEEVLPQSSNFSLGFRDIARPTDARTVIASIVPWAGYGNKVPLLVEGKSSLGKSQNQSVLSSQRNTWMMCQVVLVANLNAVCLDYIARQKIHGTSLNWYIFEQLPVIPLIEYDHPLGGKTVGDFVRDHVLRLTYTARDMTPFARGLGYEGPPFIWNEEERHHLRARLDALYFLLYGLSRDDAGYVLDTFPIIRRNDEKAFGCYRTKDLILAYMNALAAGDAETVVAV